MKSQFVMLVLVLVALQVQQSYQCGCQSTVGKFCGHDEYTYLDGSCQQQGLYQCVGPNVPAIFIENCGGVLGCNSGPVPGAAYCTAKV